MIAEDCERQSRALLPTIAEEAFQSKGYLTSVPAANRGDGRVDVIPRIRIFGEL